MLGAIIGDICASVYEDVDVYSGFGEKPETIDLFKFRDDAQYTGGAVFTCAVAEAVMSEGGDYAASISRWAKNYSREPYSRTVLRSFVGAPLESLSANEAAMVSAIGWAFPSLEATIAEATRSASCLANRDGGVKEAEAVAAAIFLARKGYEKAEIRERVEARCACSLGRSLAEIRATRRQTRRETASEGIAAFLASGSFEHAIQCALSLSGESCALAAISGAIAEAYYGEIPSAFEKRAARKITGDMQAVLDTFSFRIKWNLEDGRHYTLDELAERFGKPGKASNKRLARLRSRIGESAKAGESGLQNTGGTFNEC